MTPALTARPARQALVAHHAEIGATPLRDLFADVPQRGERLVLKAAGIYLDDSKNRVTDKTLRVLAALGERSLAALLDLLSIWNNNFLGAATQAVLPYVQYLLHLPAYLQRLTMESNGKHVRLGGEPIGVNTAPILWGEPGTHGQRSFYPLLHQETRHAHRSLRLHRLLPGAAEPARQSTRGPTCHP